MIDLSEIIIECRQMHKSGANMNEILAFLRNSGLSKAGSTKALVDAGLADMNSAKNVVHNSPVWADVHMRDEKFHQGLSDQFDE